MAFQVQSDKVIVEVTKTRTQGAEKDRPSGTEGKDKPTGTPPEIKYCYLTLMKIRCKILYSICHSKITYKNSKRYMKSEDNIYGKTSEE
ncbi:hypothetical protein [Clostridium lacusfryxellense]|uniref:hypothetical protein n=1 Tax=Clostridium lacusfryxellense TaxID=205328 RepID=UPI001C0B6DF1|nr:hypothetical protein [Clostridium lacusfryxellense]MBU3111092.1 hypothetical protein [Clostridium lacusfryxellense]